MVPLFLKRTGVFRFVIRHLRDFDVPFDDIASICVSRWFCWTFVWPLLCFSTSPNVSLKQFGSAKADLHFFMCLQLHLCQKTDTYYLKTNYVCTIWRRSICNLWSEKLAPGFTARPYSTIRYRTVTIWKISRCQKIQHDTVNCAGPLEREHPLEKQKTQKLLQTQ